MVLPPESVLLMPSCLSEQDQDDWLERRERNQMRSWSIKSLLPATVTLTPADTAGSTAGDRSDVSPPTSSFLPLNQLSSSVGSSAAHEARLV
ncbi:hypothetical protein NQZ68_023704 [Dissostichus eleginoides]|nr:hypothetical protein NQZ68_023704 [Dissostichus eleginoides]